jgi:short-subunit dehydrogenase
VAYISSYAATKAYNLILAESLWDEVRESGVDVLGFMPGATRTTGFVLSKPHLGRSTVASIMEPKPTVAEALNALGRTPSWIPGRRNRWTLTLAQRLLPRKQMIKLVGSNMRKWYGK